jgi:hypothetical protein
MTLHLEDLNDFGRARLEDDYAAVDRRDGGKTSRTDFALGWMAMAVRHRLWSYFTDEARVRLQLPSRVLSEART